MKLLLSALSLLALTALADDNIFRDGGFEFPVVTGRTPAPQGDPAKHRDHQPWLFLKLPPQKDSGVSAGVTNEVAHSGTQAFFIQFEHVARPYQGVTLVSNFIPVVSGTQYEVGLWGRTDARDLMTSKGRTAYLKLQVDYFAADAAESVGETAYRVQPIPGGKDHPPFFVPDHWTWWAVKLDTPPGAVFAQITWRWETGSDAGEFNGIIYFDDAAVLGPQVANPDMTPAPVQEDTPAPDASPTPQ